MLENILDDGVSDKVQHVYFGETKHLGVFGVLPNGCSPLPDLRRLPQTLASGPHSELERPMAVGIGCFESCVAA